MIIAVEQIVYKIYVDFLRANDISTYFTQLDLFVMMLAFVQKNLSNKIVLSFIYCLNGKM